MNVRTILLKVVDGRREGWEVMEFDEFLRLLNLHEWSAKQLLVGMVLPPVRSEDPN